MNSVQDFVHILVLLKTISLTFYSNVLIANNGKQINETCQCVFYLLIFFAKILAICINASREQDFIFLKKMGHISRVLEQQN